MHLYCCRIIIKLYNYISYIIIKFYNNTTIFSRLFPLGGLQRPQTPSWERLCFGKKCHLFFFSPMTCRNSAALFSTSNMLSRCVRHRWNFCDAQLHVLSEETLIQLYVFHTVRERISYSRTRLHSAT